MKHSHITFDNIAFHADGAPLFAPFSTHISAGTRILIIGANGSGKTTLFNLIQGNVAPTEGHIRGLDDVVVASVPQTIAAHRTLSGGERFNKALSEAIAQHPDLLCLDEPTNHLDERNRASLIRMLERYKGTLIVISHDPAILNLAFDEIWHIKDGAISIFKGSYADYQAQQKQTMQQQVERFDQLQREQKKAKKMAQYEQMRAAQSRRAHRDEKDRNIVGAMKERGSLTAGKKKKQIKEQQERIKQDLAKLHITKSIKPKFTISSSKMSPQKAVVAIANGSCGYMDPILSHIDLTVLGQERIGIVGANGSGKSTLLKAIMDDEALQKDGQWLTPTAKEIGYLDQHYATLNPILTATQMISKINPSLQHDEIQKKLHDFLFVTPESRSRSIATMSGGEKARLALACIAVQNPSVLLLDEITNNIDLETKRHITEVLKEYPGSVIVVSHDQQFMEDIGIAQFYEVAQGTLQQK